jgi:molybdenum cofactor synthesis domain-containing protein
MPTTRVAILLIGDEILSGDTQETNAHYMARRLTEVGARLERILVIPDQRDTIARFTAELSDEFDVVITCGGIGPTHDDVTMEGVAQAFGAALRAHPQLEALLREWRGEDLDDSHRRLALVPEGVSLLWTDRYFPLVQMRNVYILPGVPRLLRAKFEGVLPQIQGERLHERQFRTAQTELDLAAPLKEIQAAHPQVVIGSYPSSARRGDWAVRLVLKAHDRSALDAACEELTSRLPGVEEISLDGQPEHR